MFQSVAIVVEGLGRRFAVPLTSRIHEGLKANNKDRKTLIDKLGLEVCWLPIGEPFLVLADAYYCAADFVGLVLAQGGHVVTVARSNAVAFEAPKPKSGGPGRKPLYGAKVKLASLFGSLLCVATVKAYGQQPTEVRYWTRDLTWRGTGKVVRYVGAVFPNGKRAILMCTDTTLSPEAIIEAYSARMRIEQGFKVLLHNVGAYSYHFWTLAMQKIKRRSKGQFIHHEPEEVRSNIFETHGAFELFVGCGLIAQGLLQYLAVAFPACAAAPPQPRISGNHLGSPWGSSLSCKQRIFGSSLCFGFQSLPSSVKTKRFPAVASGSLGVRKECRPPMTSFARTVGLARWLNGPPTLEMSHASTPAWVVMRDAQGSSPLDCSWEESAPLLVPVDFFSHASAERPITSSKEQDWRILILLST
jgi:hypothetical protein